MSYRAGNASIADYDGRRKQYAQRRGMGRLCLLVFDHCPMPNSIFHITRNDAFLNNRRSIRAYRRPGRVWRGKQPFGRLFAEGRTVFKS